MSEQLFELTFKMKLPIININKKFIFANVKFKHLFIEFVSI
jgi:hypothetical protein